MNRIQNTIIAGSLLLLTMNAQAALQAEVDAPATLSLMALGLAGGVLLARYMKR
ncbi:MAG: hypothetical protein ACI87W_001346 [Halieaceae bacterium]|jgi:hypothetical protein